MSALSDLQTAVSANSSLVASLIALQASGTGVPGSISPADAAAVTSTIAATNTAIQSVLTAAGVPPTPVV